ncbi:MAG: hypothetical protein QXE51_03250 [Nitrososphaeria archaeon]
MAEVISKGGRPTKLELTQLYEIYYYYKDAPLSEQLSTTQLAKKYGVNQATISRQIAKILKIFKEIPSEYEAYIKWKDTLREPKYLFRVIETPQGIKFDSPYQWIVSYAERGFARARNKPKYVHNLKNRMSLAERVWTILGKTNPMTWTEQHVNKVLAEVKEGSRYNVVVAMRMISPPLKAIQGLTLSLKPPPKSVPIISSPNFPQLWRQLIAEARRNASDEREADEIELIIVVKSMTGIRTGSRQFEQGLWGTKIAEGRSKLEIVGDDFVWTVYEKKDEIWDINFKTEQLKAVVVNFVKKYGLKKGDWLISISPQRAGFLIKQACEKLNITALTMHDLRRVYVSFLVRAGIPLERAIKLNVGWTDIGTANKHYLQFSSLWEDIEDRRRKFENLFMR